MRVKHHLFSAVPVAAAMYTLGRDAASIAIAAGFTVLIDADHVLDYLINRKKIASLKTMSDAYGQPGAITRFFLLLHSWELVIALMFVAAITLNEYLVALLTGWVYHLLFDQVYNTRFSGKYDVKEFFYFFFFRLARRFEVVRLRKDPEPFQKE